MKIPLERKPICAPEEVTETEDDIIVDEEPIILTHDLVEAMILTVLMEKPRTVREIKKVIYDYFKCNVSEQRIRKVIMEHKSKPPLIEWDGSIRRFRIINLKPEANGNDRENKGKNNINQG